MAGEIYYPWEAPTIPDTIKQDAATTAATKVSPRERMISDVFNMATSTPEEGAPRRSPWGTAKAIYDRIDDYLDYEAPEVENMLSYMIPVLGTARTFGDIKDNAEAGNTGRAALDLGLGLLSMAPGLGGVGAGLGKAAAKGAGWVANTAKAATKAATRGSKYADDVAAVASKLGRELSAEEKAAVAALGNDLSPVNRWLLEAQGKAVPVRGATKLKSGTGGLDDIIKGIKGGKTGGNAAARTKAQTANEGITKIDNKLDDLAAKYDKFSPDVAEEAGDKMLAQIAAAEDELRPLLGDNADEILKAMSEAPDAKAVASARKSSGTKPHKVKEEVPELVEDTYKIRTGEGEDAISSLSDEEAKALLERVLTQIKESQAPGRLSQARTFVNDYSHALRKLEEGEAPRKLFAKYAPATWASKALYAPTAASIGPGTTQQGQERYWQGLDRDYALTALGMPSGRYAYINPTQQ